ncbi:MAG: MBL fold metallo-hydrolase [Chloroflexota bacterium]
MLTLNTDQVGPWGMNSYALICDQTQESVLIDPGGDPDKLQALLANSQPVAILLTHTHVDHVMALETMLEQLDVPLLLNNGEHAADFQMPDCEHSFLADNDSFIFGEQMLHVRYAPGHIGDQICFMIDGDHRIIVGDTIFEGGPSKTWSNEGFQQTLVTLKNVVLPWPDDSVCYPGHGPSFRLGDIRPQVETFIAKDHGDFFGDAEWGM